MTRQKTFGPWTVRIEVIGPESKGEEHLLMGMLGLTGGCLYAASKQAVDEELVVALKKSAELAWR